jgi:hypothetical protein
MFYIKLCILAINVFACIHYEISIKHSETVDYFDALLLHHDVLILKFREGKP